MAENSKADMYDLIERARSGDACAMEELAVSNKGLIKKVALKFIGRGYELEDLMQIGYIGFLKAIERFDTDRGLMLSTYAVPMIMGEIKRYLRDDGRIKVSRQIKQEVIELRRIQEKFYNTHGIQPKVSELSVLMNMEKEKIIELMGISDSLFSIASLDDAQNIVIQKAESYEENGGLEIICLKGCLDMLSEKERKVIVLRYFKDYTQQQIAKSIGISQVQVSRIEKKVLEKLRKNML